MSGPGLDGVGVDRVPSVLVVILNWNGWEETLGAVASVLRMEYANFRVLLVDNGSTDGSVAELRKVVGERVEMVELAANTGYTGGCNVGLERGLEGGFGYVWLLNNDAVTEPGTMASLVAKAESDEGIGLVTPRIFSLEEEPASTFAGAVFLKERGVYDVTADAELAGQWATEMPGASVVIGTALLVPMRVTRKIGLMDPKLFAYWEDIDYSVRSAEAGFRNVVDAGSKVFHTEKQPVLEPHTIKPHYWYYMARNESVFWRKHVGWKGSLRPSLWSTQRFLGHLNRCRTNEVSVGAILAGLWHGWLGRGGPYRPEYRMPGAVASMVRTYGRRRGILEG